jgi:hypothetical protein
MIMLNSVELKDLTFHVMKGMKKGRNRVAGSKVNKREWSKWELVNESEWEGGCERKGRRE